VTVDAIVAANKLLNRHMIRAGQVLTIPTPVSFGMALPRGEAPMRAPGASAQGRGG